MLQDIHNDQLTFNNASVNDPDAPLMSTQIKVPQQQAGNDFQQQGQIALNEGIFGVGVPSGYPPNPITGFPADSAPESLALPLSVQFASTIQDLNRILGSQQAIRGLLFGVSQAIAKRIVRTFIKADQGSCTKRVEIQEDQAGNFFFYRKGWLNLHVELNTTNTWLNHNLILSAPTSTTTISSTPSFSVRIPFSAEIDGYFVRCINPDSVLAGFLAPGDLITEIACQKLGANGVGFYSILWKFKPGDTVRLTYYQNANNYATASCAMVRLEDILVDFPLETVGVLQMFNGTVMFGYDPMPLCGPDSFAFDDFDFVTDLNGGYVSGGLGNSGDLEEHL
jgi:hypothetical protein